MKVRRILPVLSLALFPDAAAAQDAVKVDPAHYKVVFENPTVRVLRISYPVGGKSVMHQHPDSMVIPLVDSTVRFTLPDGKSQDQTLANESASYTAAGTHNPANIGKAPVDAILIEFKTAAPGKTTWQRGEVVFIGRGVAHESKNAGSKPVEFVVVSIK